MPHALDAVEPCESLEQLRQLGHGRQRGIERCQVAALVLEVALPAHRAEGEVPERCRLAGKPQAVRHAPAPTRLGDLRVGRAPRQLHRGARRVPGGEGRALVGRVGPHEHGAPALPLQVDLHGVVVRVTEDPRAVALIGGRVVEPRLGQLQHRRHRRRVEQQEQRTQRDHPGLPGRPGRFTGPRPLGSRLVIRRCAAPRP